MIGPIFLRGEFIEKFREHLLNVPYYQVVHQGISFVDNGMKKGSTDEVNEIINQFVQARFPIVSFAGSKSSIPFWDYHLAMQYDEEKRTAIICELLVRELNQDHCRKALLMAYYFLVNPKMEVERIQAPMNLSNLADCKEFEDIMIEFIPHQNITYLS
ncbi:hypothetical protein [Brevibacillus brevis]|uniref:hypothetical protein n=1 Tax=Brevibacillus brevis TaxID=1393 RepID=UPI00115AB4EC|nr:hypothetical protein [Lysinibacillus sp. SDF0063]TQR33915.1 hypothetical protein C7Y45_18090 [Lysinibacillus sp. SDF0063]